MKDKESDDLKPEYDFSKGVRGKYARRFAEGVTVTVETPPLTTIDNPILNSPFHEPQRHFKLTDSGITNEIIESRRVSTYLMPAVPVARKRGSKNQQLTFHEDWAPERVEENKFINQIRSRVARWRDLGRPNITRTSLRLLDYWARSDRERRLFFCQIEALETAIYLAEAAGKQGDAWIHSDLRDFNDDANPGLFRIALKMATGSGKTVVMAMLIAWQALNKWANKQDKRFTDAFLLVTPGITIRDRLRVLYPNDNDNYYTKLDLIPPDLYPHLNKAKIVITNFHAFKPRERTKASKLIKSLLDSPEGAFTETPAQMVSRVCADFGNKKGIIVLNDEAHHCYSRKPDAQPEAELKGEEKDEVQTRNEHARLWISGLFEVSKRLEVRAVYDLSATPFFLKGSGYDEGTLFPWVVSDFSLIDAIESGIVKVPRVPVADDSMRGDQPTYRDIWSRIKDDLPKKPTANQTFEPVIPAALELALHSLYSNYEKAYQAWETGDQTASPPPVFIVVCKNTAISKLLFRWIAGWEKTLPSGDTIWHAGNLEIFSNVKDGHPVKKPNSFIFDSVQIDSGEAMSADFKKFMATEIAEFKREYAARYPGRDPNDITDESMIREVLNTVGKLGKLGGNVKCVVSVSMLTEGWDANTVTHILGVRPFTTQLLCEQVVGRGLRRMSYEADEHGFFSPEYAEVYGIPFSFIPCSGSTAATQPPKAVTHVRALEERAHLAIDFPRVTGYRLDFPAESLSEPKFSAQSHHVLDTTDIAVTTEVRTIIGQEEMHTLEGLKKRRMQEVCFLLSKLVLELHLKDGQGNPRPWLFPPLLRITERWLQECLTCKDNTFPQLLLVQEKARGAAEKIARAVVAATTGEKRLLPILQTFETVGSTDSVNFYTSKPVFETDPTRSHISHVVADTKSWEQKLAQSLEDMDEVVSYAKNQNLDFTIPYVFEGRERQYYPDFVARVNIGEETPLSLIIEVTGQPNDAKTAKIDTAANLWVPAINNDGRYGKWDFLNCTDPWDAKNVIRTHLSRVRSN